MTIIFLCREKSYSSVEHIRPALVLPNWDPKKENFGQSIFFTSNRLVILNIVSFIWQHLSVFEWKSWLNKASTSKQPLLKKNSIFKCFWGLYRVYNMLNIEQIYNVSSVTFWLHFWDYLVIYWRTCIGIFSDTKVPAWRHPCLPKTPL